MSSSKSLQILRFAQWLEDAETLGFAAKNCISDDRKDALTHAMSDNPVAVSALAVLEVLRNPTSRVCTTQLKRVDAVIVIEQRTRILKEVVKTQLLRMAKQTARAREQLRVTLAELDKLSPDITLSADFAAIHNRNVLELSDDKRLRAQAAGFFRSYFNGGYACFKRWAEVA
jgi:hypothetical protein